MLRCTNISYLVYLCLVISSVIIPMYCQEFMLVHIEPKNTRTVYRHTTSIKIDLTHGNPS
jgi:hypothetical protein